MKSAKGMERWKCSFRRLNKGRCLKDQKPQESIRSRPDLKIREAVRDTAFTVGVRR